LKVLLLLFLGIFGFGHVDATEPKFIALDSKDTEMKKAYALTANTIYQFIDLVKAGGEGEHMAKLRFRNPDLSEELGKDQFLYIWLSNVAYHPEEKILSGVFFEVPKELKKWHQVGQRLGFESDDVFDWMVNDNGKVKGGFTIRVARNKLKSEKEKLEYDKYIGVSSYESINY